MNGKLIEALFLMATLGCAHGSEALQMVKFSASSYSIVTKDELAPAEKFLLTDFTNLLTRATGVDFKVCGSSERPGEKRIFFGVPPAGAPELPDQVRRVAVIGDDLYLYGGGANGTRYAVYDFLMNDLGYRFFDARGGMRVPDARNFTMLRVDRQRRHDFAERYISIWGRFTVPESSMFVYRHGLNGKIAQLLKRDNLGEAVNDYDVPHPGDASLVHYLPRNSKASTIGWIKKLNENATIPTYGSPYAAGADLYACIENDEVIKAGETKLIKTGLAIELPVGYAAFIYARSGLASKRGLAPANKVGVVDCDYRGEIMVALHNHGEAAQTIGHGERIAQMVITPVLTPVYEVVFDLNDTQRGAGGFRSTGK
jgi:dUTP pyrophosphatase